MRQHMFSNLELLSLVFLVATTLIHVRYKSDSSTLATTSSTKYLVGLKCPPSFRVTGAGFCSSMVEAPVESIASRYPSIHSFPAITTFSQFFPRKWQQRKKITSGVLCVCSKQFRIYQKSVSNKIVFKEKYMRKK